MGFLELLLIGIGLSMDAFAVAVCKGLCMKRVNKGHALLIALYFGAFQALMPLLGWFLGKQFESLIVSVDHWIAFALLGFIGAKMIKDAFSDKDDVPTSCEVKHRELLVLAIATSIDALAVGITFAFLQVEIFSAIAIIGIVTFVICVGGVFVGNIFGAKYKRKAAVAGGIILILIGLKILLEHLGILVF